MKLYRQFNVVSAYLSFSALLFLIGSCSVKSATPDLQPIFDKYGYKGCIVVYDLNHNKTIMHNPERCDQEYIPASTFKIPNTLIALDAGIVENGDHQMKWDSVERNVKSWNRDHTLQTAYDNSAVWYYQELARQAGSERMQEYMDLFDYGNRDIGGALDSFWLNGNIRITAVQQIEFLKKIHLNQLDVKASALEELKRIMVREENPEYTLRAKTGWGFRAGVDIGWFVGYLETEENVFFFATNIEGRGDFEGFGQARVQITMDILRKLKIIATVDGRGFLMN